MSELHDWTAPGAKPFDGEYPRIVTPPPGVKAQGIIARDAEYSSTSYIKEYPLAVARGEGAIIEDVDGNRYIDFMAGIAVSSTGYAHPKVVEAVRDAAGDFFHICGTDFYYEGMSALCERLATCGLGPSKKRVFLTNSGTECVEGAIKLVRNSTRRHALVAFKRAFHGRSYGAMSLTSSKVKQKGTFGPMLPGIHHVTYPDPYRMGGEGIAGNRGDDSAGYPRTGTSLAEFGLAQLHELFERQVAPEDVAAIFIEPMLGEGGYVIPPREFIVGLRQICDEHGILLVFDEVQSGVGRTGKMWAADCFDVEPDVLLTAKGLASGMPIGAIIARESIMKWPSGSHGSTFGGNPVACAAALATLDIVENELLDHVNAMGERMMAGLRKLQDKHDCIGDVRGRGLYIGVEFVKDRQTKEPAKYLVEKLGQLAFTRGLLLLSCGKSVVRIAPPLVLNEYDVDTGLEIMDACLTELTA